jgi:hypothetical protein
MINVLVALLTLQALSQHGERWSGSERWSDSTHNETFRATMQAHLVDGTPTTLIVTRQGLGGDGRVWLTFHGAIKTTVVMTNPETAHLVELLNKASGR